MTDDRKDPLILELEASMREADRANDAVETSADAPHVSHYCRGGIECIDVMRAISTRAEFAAFCKLSAVKYLWRLGYKGDPAGDARKAEHYVRWLRERLERD